MSLPDTAEYWDDIKNRRRYPRHVFTHLKGVDCGHYHIKESIDGREIDCKACRKIIKNKVKEIENDTTRIS